MKSQLKTILLSHLSDMEFEIDYQHVIGNVKTRIKFVKWLLMKYHNTNIEIDPDIEYKIFLNQ